MSHPTSCVLRPVSYVLCPTSHVLPTPYSLLPIPYSLFPTVPIRDATSADLAAITRLINAAFEVEQFFITGPRTTEDECARHLAAEGTTILVATATDAPDDPILGTVVVRMQGARGYFGMLAIAPDRQGEGFGRRLIGAAEDLARRHGCTRMEIRVVDLRTELPPLYEALGYRVTGTAPFSEPATLRRPAHFLVMSKPL